MDTVLLSSGFTIPANPDYLPITENIDIVDSLLSINRIDYSAMDKKRLVSYNVHINVKNNDLYMDYITNKDFKSYIGIIDRIYTDLGSVPVYIWLAMQLESDTLSPIVKSHLLGFLKNLMMSGSKPTTNLYIPFNLRLSARVCNTDKTDYLKELDAITKPRDFISTFPLNWKNFIVLLHNEKKVLEFFKLVLVDFY
jgi:hypothetical protein